MQKVSSKKLKNIFYFQELDVDVKLQAYLAPFNTIEDFKVLYPAVNIIFYFKVL